MKLGPERFEKLGLEGLQIKLISVVVSFKSFLIPSLSFSRSFVSFLVSHCFEAFLASQIRFWSKMQHHAGKSSGTYRKWSLSHTFSPWMVTTCLVCGCGHRPTTHSTGHQDCSWSDATSFYGGSRLGNTGGANQPGKNSRTHHDASRYSGQQIQ